MRYLIPLILSLTGCAAPGSSSLVVDGPLTINLLTSVGDGCTAERGLERSQEGQGEATGELGVNVVAQAGDAGGAAEGIGALAAILRSRVGCP